MKPFILQDWITVKSSGTPPAPQGPNFIQDAAGWLDLALFQDVVVWFDVRQATRPGDVVGKTLTWHFQTAPTKDDVLFHNLHPAAAPVIGTLPTRLLFVIPYTQANAIATATPPLSRWLRWMIVPSDNLPWTATFRIIVAANQVTLGASLEGRSTALQSAMARLSRFETTKPKTAPSSVVSIQQTTTPISLQGPSPQDAVSLVQPVANAMNLGGREGIAP